MAQNYVAIDFGTPGAPPVEDQAILQTTEQPDLGQLFAKLDAVSTGVENLTRSFSGEKIDDLPWAVDRFHQRQPEQRHRQPSAT
jgi:hypothetical protein